jgi:hypothetical protein
VLPEKRVNNTDQAEPGEYALGGGEQLPEIAGASWRGNAEEIVRPVRKEDNNREHKCNAN